MREAVTFVIAEQLAMWDVFGTVDLELIADTIDAFARAHLDA